jgi:predicted Zn-ribbon and HTH transcriptional regulator
MTRNNPETVAEIIRLRNEEKKKWREIGEAIDMSPQYARTLYIHNLGYEQSDSPTSYSFDDEGRSQQILHLRDNEQRTLEEIAEVYGITRERVRQIYRRAGGQLSGILPRLKREPHYCMDCGKEMARNSNKSLRCRNCNIIHQRKIRKFWNEETIIAAIQKFKERYGRWPVATDFNPGMADRLGKPEIRKRFENDGDYPYVNTVRGVFGSWNNGLQAAGRAREDLYITNTQAFDDPGAMQRTQEFLDAGLSFPEIANLEKISVQGVQMRKRLLEQGHARRSIVTGEVKHFYASQVVDGKMGIGEAAREIGTSYSVVQAWAADEKFKREHAEEAA